MNTFFKEKDEKKDTDKVSHLHLVKTDGIDGPPGGNWLSQLPDGSVVLARDLHNAGYEVGQYTILAHAEKDVLLYASFGVRDITMWVDPIRFCQVTKLRTILQYGEEETKWET